MTSFQTINYPPSTFNHQISTIHHQPHPMLPFAFYLLKVTLCSAILFGYYFFMLRNKIFHHYNRFYLLASLALSVVLPLIKINIWHSANSPAPQAIKLLQVVNSNEYLDKIVISSRENNFTSEQVLLLFYSITTIIFAGLFIDMLLRIRTLFVKHRHSLVEDIYFVNTTAKGTPFSFLKYIFWNDHIDPESTTGHQIFKHELAHVQQKHSYDKLFVNIALIFFWCNPFFWLIRKELNMIHEFLADKIAVEDNDTEAFAAMILQAAYPQHRFHLTSPFFYSPIKRRLMMLTKNRNTKVGYIGRLLVLPLTVLVFAAFTLKAKTFKQSNQSFGGKTITVVIDAGHGGNDAGARSFAGNIVEKDLALAIIKKIKALNSNAGIQIILTRETDVFQSVKEKAAFSKSQKADLFVSIHLDATSNDSADVKTGMSVWVAKDNYVNSNDSKLFASAIIHEFSNEYKLPVNKLPQQSRIGILVLQESPCPSVLIEAGYITNKKDLAYLQTEAAQEIIARNILLAVEKYAGAKEKNETGIGIQNSGMNQNLAIAKVDTIPKIAIKNIKKALIIADGNIISQNELKAIHPNLIESVNILSPKEGFNKYGEKGKNGVVIIKKKKKELVSNDLEITVKNDSSVQKANLNGNIKLKNEINPGTQPLYVIDGKVQSIGFDLSSIDPNNIESINVIKGEKAADKYGEKAVNGVIEIITKNKAVIKKISISDALKNNDTNNIAETGNGLNTKQQE